MCPMLCEWNGEARTWELLADSGETLAVIRPVGDDIWEGTTLPPLSPVTATGELTEVRTWLTTIAQALTR